MAVNTLMQIRRGTAAAWTSANPTLAAGEWALETDTKLLKMGDGSTVWTSLAYVVPTQTGQSGKYLTTNGTVTSWGTVAGDIEGVTAGTGLTGGGTSGTVTVGLDTASAYVVPTQTGQSGKYLTTDGTASSWATVDALPTQTGNSGKYLTTNGSAASWATIVTDPTPSIFMLMGA
jgi:hypothetical protein